MKIYEVIAEESKPDTVLSLIKDTAKHLDPARKEELIFKSGWLPKNTFRFMTFIKWLGALEISYTYLAQAALINKAIKEGKMPESDRMPAYRIIVEETIVAILASGAIIKCIKMLINFTIVGRLAAWLAGGAATVASLGVFGGPAILEILATTAASIWLQQWVQTKEGKEVIANCVMYAIDPALTWVWNQGPGKFISSLKAQSISDQGTNKLEKPNADSTSIAGKPSADAKKDIAASSADMFTPVPAYDPHTGKDLGWASTNKYMTKGGGTASPVAPK